MRRNQDNMFNVMRESLDKLPIIWREIYSEAQKKLPDGESYVWQQLLIAADEIQVLEKDLNCTLSFIKKTKGYDIKSAEG